MRGDQTVTIGPELGPLAEKKHRKLWLLRWLDGVHCRLSSNHPGSNPFWSVNLLKRKWCLIENSKISKNCSFPLNREIYFHIIPTQGLLYFSEQLHLSQAKLFNDGINLR